MMFHFNSFASMLSAVTMAATSAPTHASERRHLIHDTKNDGGPMDVTGDRNPFVPSKIAESYNPRLDADKKDMVLLLHPRPIFPGKKEQKVQAGTLRNTTETTSDGKSDRNQTANISTPFNPSLDLGILDRKRISNDRSIHHHRKLDGLDCNGDHPLIPAIAPFAKLIEACLLSDECPPIGCFDTSLVTDMSGALYYTERGFNEDVSAWVTSSVTSMRYMFSGANAFNQPVDSWDVSSVTNMEFMFSGAKAFNQPVDSWDVSSVTNMEFMFTEATDFNQPVDSWDVSSVTNMEYMFYLATDFNQPVDSWDVSSVTIMEFMFYRAKAFNQPVDSWDVSSVTSMVVMFGRALDFNQPVDSWDVSSVYNMYGMFLQAYEFNQPVDSWNVSAVKTMERMFRNAREFNQPVDSWNVSSVIYMAGMFRDAREFNQPVDSWNVSSVTRMGSMFYRAYDFNQPIDSWDVSSVTDMPFMFNYAREFNQCLSTWSDKVPPAVDTDYMFNNTGCPIDIPDPNGPWCQDADVCRNVCENNPAPFYLQTSCEEIATLLPKTIKQLCDIGIAKDCPELCPGNEICPCADFILPFSFKEETTSCTEVAGFKESKQEKKCRKNQIADNCPGVCTCGTF